MIWFCGLVMANLGFQVNYKHLKLHESQGFAQNSGGHFLVKLFKVKKNSPKFQSFEVIRPTLTWFTPSGGSL